MHRLTGRAIGQRRLEGDRVAYVDSRELCSAHRASNTSCLQPCGSARCGISFWLRSLDILALRYFRIAGQQYARSVSRPHVLRTWHNCTQKHLCLDIIGSPMPSLHIAQNDLIRGLFTARKLSTARERSVHICVPLSKAHPYEESRH